MDGSPSNSSRTPDPGVSPSAWLIVLSMAAVLLLGRLASPLLEPEEARYAEIPRQMLAEGRFVIPVWHGEDYLHKPPLLYWLVMASYQIFGVHDWAARMVPVLASWLVVLISAWWARRTVGAWAGFCSALILSLAPQFIYQGGMLTFDSLLSLWVILGLAAAHLAFTPSPQPRVPEYRGEGLLGFRWWLVSAVSCGLGILTKGPVALVLIVTPVVLHQLWDRRSVRISLGAWLAYVGVSLAIAAPWFVALAWLNPQALHDFFWLHHVERFLTPFDHEEPVWFFVPRVMIGMLPWSLLIIPLVLQAVRRPWRWADSRQAKSGFFVLAFATCLVLYSLSGSKRPAYIVPALPLFVLMLGTYLSRAASIRRWLRARAWPRRLAVGSAAALFAMLVVGVFGLLPAYHRRFGLDEQMEASAMDDCAVATYPKRWDSVSFYLQRNDVAVYTPDQRDRLIEDLQTRGRTLLFVKKQGALDELLVALPSSMEFVPHGPTTGKVVVGLVRRRLEVLGVNPLLHETLQENQSPTR